MIEKVEQTPYQIEEAQTRGSLARNMLAKLIMDGRRERRKLDGAPRYGDYYPVQLERAIAFEACAEIARRILYGWEL